MQIVPVEEIPAKTEPVPKDDLVEVYKVCRQLEMICRNHNGLGVSVTQVGIPWKLFIVNDDGCYRYFIDCEYEAAVGAHKRPQIEGCLSLPGQLFRTERWEQAVVTGWELVVRDGNLELMPFTETTPEVVYQHEIDHHNDILIRDFGTPISVRPINYPEV